MENGERSARQARDGPTEGQGVPPLHDMTEKISQTQPRVSGLLPVAILLALFLGVGIPLHGQVALPAIVPFLAALGVAFLQCRHRTFPERLNVVARAMGQTDVMVMCLVFLLAGAFAGAAEAAGCVTSTVNFGLSVLPAWATVAGLFVIASFASTAMGTSVGTITAIAPIAVGIAEATGMGAPLCLGAVVCGAMFGDNLSIISDTTIAATRTQGCDMRAKFRENLRLVWPAALITVVLFIAVAPGGGVPAGDHPFSVPLLLPYLAVLVTALCGMNVVLVLALGTLLSLGVGIGMGELPAAEAFRAVGDGVAKMYDITAISLVVAGVLGLVRENGGIDWLLRHVLRRVRGRRGAQAGIAALVSAVDVATANNTVAIVMAGPVVRDVAQRHGVSPARAASLIDIYASVWQGLLPYGAQLLAAAAAASVTPAALLPWLFYPILMGVTVPLVLLIRTSMRRKP